MRVDIFKGDKGRRKRSHTTPLYSWKDGSALMPKEGDASVPALRRER